MVSLDNASTIWLLSHKLHTIKIKGSEHHSMKSLEVGLLYCFLLTLQSKKVLILLYSLNFIVTLGLQPES